MIYEKMKAATEAVGVYSPDAVNLGHELRVYAEELDLLYEDLDDMFRERFISTAGELGLSAYEELFGPVRSDLSLAERRERLYLRMNLGEGDFTLAGIRKALDSFGLSCTIDEYPELGRLNITATTDYSPREQAYIRGQVSKIIPAHIEFQLTFNTLTWDQIDALDLTFAQFDEEDLTWNELDLRSNS